MSERARKFFERKLDLRRVLHVLGAVVDNLSDELGIRKPTVFSLVENLFWKRYVTYNTDGDGELVERNERSSNGGRGSLSLVHGHHHRNDWKEMEIMFNDQRRHTNQRFKSLTSDSESSNNSTDNQSIDIVGSSLNKGSNSEDCGSGNNSSLTSDDICDERSRESSEEGTDGEKGSDEGFRSRRNTVGHALVLGCRRQERKKTCKRMPARLGEQCLTYRYFHSWLHHREIRNRR